MRYQFFYGKKFYLDQKTGYWISTSAKKIRAHVFVWEYNNGKIPKGFHIHHKDGNKSNNVLSNLECIEKRKHLSMHMNSERRAEASKRMHEIVRPLADLWHGTPEGIEWHKKHAQEMNFGHWNLKDISCLICLKQFKPKVHHQKFCHANCRAKYGRRIQKDKKHQKT